MKTAHRPGKNALDEFLLEAELRLEDREDQVDPQDVQLDSVETMRAQVAVEFPTTSPEAVRTANALDHSRVEWWPMCAAALVGIGVSLLAFGALVRFGQP